MVYIVSFSNKSNYILCYNIAVSLASKGFLVDLNNLNKKMKTAVMQPYILPYIGYWQLIKAVDAFVLLDDVNFIMRGWINRNYLLLNGQPHLFSIPLEKPSQNKLINETKLCFDSKTRETLLKTITLAYKKSHQFNYVYPIIEEIFSNPETDLTKFILNSFEKITQYLDIKTEFLLSSQIEKDNSLKGEERIIEICQKLNTKTYINLPGGRELYHDEKFKHAGMNLKFIQPNLEKIIYPQFKNNFITNLSFLDIIMFNDKEKVNKFLEDYSSI